MYQHYTIRILLQYFSNFSLRYKQNKYPVLLLTQGVNTKYDQYLDQRTHNINNGSHFAATADILGIYENSIKKLIFGTDYLLNRNGDSEFF